jgi:organic radical activating enzyme
VNKGDQSHNGKSQFQFSAEKMREQLGPALCLAKWKQVSLHLPTGLNNSCYHPPLHRIPVDEITSNPGALHNTAYKKQQRRDMLEGKRPKECQYCWNMEDLGNLSDRHYRSGEPWAAADFEQIKNSTGDEDDVIPSYVEVNFNHSCNLKCSYCSPQFSSSWADEVARHGAYPTQVPHNSPDHFTGNRRIIPVREENPYVDAFWKWWPQLYPHLEHFRMTGGEPLMDKNTYRVFDYVLANPSQKLHLNVTSNFSVDEKLFERYLESVKKLCSGNNVEHFMQYVSLDAWGEPAEYIRHGLDFELVWRRVQRFLTEVPERSSLTFIITMNNLSVGSLHQLMQRILELRKKHSSTYQRVWFDMPVLQQPAWQSLQILPSSYVAVLQKLKDWMIQIPETEDTRFHGFKDYEVQRLDRDINWMSLGQSLDTRVLNRHRADFYRFFSEHDQRRQTDFLTTFPEMKSWWEECRYHANQ